ncbi:MAG: hypothetical protein QOI82_790 [Actinomycetota bacterium]|nr:hypothetical protein [Actinomycetota bacterium]
MPRYRSVLSMLACAGLAVAAVPGAAFAATSPPAPLTVQLTGQVLQGLDKLANLGRVDATSNLQIGLSVEGRDALARDALAHAVSDPKSPSYKHFLSPSEYAARFGVEPARRAAIQRWLQTGGLKVEQSSAAGTFFLISGPAAAVERQFGTQLNNYRLGTQIIRANATAPRVPATLGIHGVMGLETAHRFATHAAAPTAFPVSADTTPSDLWSIYDQPANNRGAGQQLAMFGWGDPTGVERDLRLFETKYGLPRIPFEVRHAGPAGTDTAGLTEWDIDTQASSGMAPDASKLTAYFGTSGLITDGVAALQLWADQADGAKQASASYGLCEGLPIASYDTIDVPVDRVLQQAVLEGRSLFASTGDTASGCPFAGAGVNGVTYGPVPAQEYPAASPWAIGVGGTVITKQSGTPAKRDIEYAWTHGGGGASPLVPAPDYQQGVTNLDRPCIVNSNGGIDIPPPVCRGLPDVAAQSGDLISAYEIVVDSADSFGSGTSLAAPLMQGMWTRINAAAPLVNGTAAGLGFANPHFYRLGKDATTHAATFYDVTVGSNGNPALAGWDYTTGWGVPDVTKMAQALDGGTDPTDPTGTGAGGGGGGVVVTPAPTVDACPTPDQIVDPAGDTTIAGEPQSAPDSDLRAGRLAWDPDTSSLVGTLRLEHLDDTLPDTSLGRDYLLGFSIGNSDYTLEYDHHKATVNFGSPPDSTATETRRFYLLKAGNELGDVPGVVDTTTASIRFTLSAARLAELDPVAPALTATTQLHAPLLDSREFVETGYYSVDDAGPIACAATPGVVDPGANVPEIGFAALLPLAGLTVGGLLFLRRRRAA